MSFVLVAPAPFVSTLSAFNGSPYANSIATVGGTLQFSAFAWDGLGILNPPFGDPLQPQPTWTWSSSNTGIATINSSTGLVTGAGSGVCQITASSTVGLQILAGSAMLGVGLISPASATINYGQTQLFTASSTAQWFSGIPAVAQMSTGNTNGLGSSATAVTGLTPNFPSGSAVVPVYAVIGGYGFNGLEGVIAQASLTVNNIP